MEFGDMSVVVTACKRPAYLAQVLGTWANATGLPMARRFIVALGYSGARKSLLETIAKVQVTFPLPIDVIEDSPEAAISPGMHRALGEAADQAFSDPANGFVVFGEEDVSVSDDVFLYMRWAAERFRDDERVVAALAHNRGGSGWDGLTPPQDADADQAAVRLLPYFNGWGWGTWPDRWAKVLRPSWDWEANSGGASDSGYDWNIQKRVLPAAGGLCVVPDAARSQTIGEHGGTYSSPASWAFSQSQSFRAERGLVQYALVEA